MEQTGRKLSTVRKILALEHEQPQNISQVFTIGGSTKMFSFFHVAPNPCSSGYMNYCDHNAECRPSTRSFICQCKDGYTDVSFNKLETPGERCKRKFYTFIPCQKQVKISRIAVKCQIQ